jgi:hypothetical protein
VRRVIRFCSVLSLGLLPLCVAEARERLVMPFTCAVEGGEVRLARGAEHSYRILGTRHEEVVTACTSANSAGCRTVMVHRFNIACAGAPVAWMEVAAAIGSAAANRVWVEGGRLNLVMPGRAVATPASCLKGSDGNGLEHRVVLKGDCLPWSRRAQVEHLVLPEGFAPVGELGARLMIDGAPVLHEGGDGLAIQRVALTDAEMAVAKADPDAILEPSGRIETFETALEPDLAANEWITVVHAAPDMVAASVEPSASGRMAWLLVVAAAAALGLLAAIRRAPQLRMRAARPFNLAHGDATLVNALDAVLALVQQTEAAVAELKGAGPLREVLEGELDLMRARIAHIDKLAANGEMPPERSAPQLRALVRDLDRIRRIVDSAAASLAHGKRPTALPRTTSEAYEVLGVNAEVSAGVLKKIVDALRMSWHPDHARDADDRMAREDRIRQINIAWDLINGKREAA